MITPNKNFTSKLKNLIERRLSRKEVKTDAKELVGSPRHPADVGAGLGYNLRRTIKQLRRHEPKAKPITNKEVGTMRVAGKTAKLGGAKNPITKTIATALLQARALRGKNMRGYIQNIPKMIKTYKKDPDAFPAASRITPDPNNPYTKDKDDNDYTQLGGRTRTATSRLATGQPPKFITIPSQRHSSTTKRFKKFVQSGDYDKKVKTLKQKGKTLKGQDPRLIKNVDKYK